ncbi:Stp1/IreP family PP2C-type Ser/Thr phosphatase [Evansella cellulosilytica]|uniref:protein-serine/threonine phosphatase n=1 Tax=Evansella cellulosilytica (strain ATCC 21833 / DSM 2522 / FERM P-1141 / JCM 9156 / N-4) TaxID=649639 RepID=E6TTN8_EVAC2|nr:Stp1/IreP family PP2C-type Ser/Thr phosphatase [Evansella cellulosilytica]ADU30807.1 protein serine/threonine phosphatase [Evansella cellulosilytica DSM 2522]
MDAVFLTDVGQLRPHNEDDGAFQQDNLGQLIALVADGMGGHQAGDVASKMTKEALINKWKQNDTQFTAGEAEKWLEDAIHEVNSTLYEHAQNNPECEGMGTTLVAAICNSQFISVAHVGDSRIYLKSPTGLKQMTEDHTLVGELVRSGQITEEEAMFHPRKNVVLRALGTEPSIKVDIDTIHWEEGSSLLLCSDGLTNKIDDDDINEMLSLNKPLHTIAEGFIQMANDRGGEDNVTIAIVRHSITQKEVADA